MTDEGDPIVRSVALGDPRAARRAAERKRSANELPLEWTIGFQLFAFINRVFVLCLFLVPLPFISSIFEILFSLDFRLLVSFFSISGLH
jgi:hypothetical protein